jgi:hypothetical protein
MQTSNSQEVICEQEPEHGSLLRPELKDFIRRVVVPILVDRHLKGTRGLETEAGSGRWARNAGSNARPND